MKLTYLVLNLLCWSSLVLTQSTSNDSFVRQVAIIFRHGDRNPESTYANDPYRDYPWPNGYGALTTTGMNQLYQLGKWIRNEYDDLIGKKYEASKMLIQSSDADRAIMSTQSVLSALFRPEPADYFVDNLSWRPVPVHTIPKNIDNLLWLWPDCPALERDRNAHKDEIMMVDKEKAASFYAELSNYTGQLINDIDNVTELYDNLIVENIKDLKLPKWADEIGMTKIKDYFANWQGVASATTLQKRLRGGPLLKEIITNMVDAVKCKNEKTLYLYGGHDLTLVTLVRTMGISEILKPDYGATLIFELFATKVSDNNMDYSVKVQYLNNTQTTKAITLEIPGCDGSTCKLAELLGIWQDVLPTNWNAECLA